MAHLSISLLGPFAVTRGDQPIPPFTYDKVRGLLAYLAVERERPQRRDTLCGLLWPELDQVRSRQNLSQALYALRQILEPAQPDLLLANRSEIQLNPQLPWSVDVAEFEDLTTQAMEYQGDAPLDLLEQAIGLYQGEFLTGFSLPDAAEYDEWLLLQRERCHLLALTCLHRLADGYERAGSYTKALNHARHLTVLDSWNEPNHRQIMRLLTALDRRGEALAHFEECRRILQEGIGVEPSEESWALFRAIRDGSPVEPEMVQIQKKSELGRRRSLPTPRAGFVGRETELAQIERRLADPACRLLTIVGMGGMGKSQLALRATHAHAHRFVHGAIFVSLAAVNSAQGILSTILNSLGAPPGTGADRLAEILGPLNLLLVLDNCEHLTTHANLFARLLDQGPTLKILTTSRQRLNLQEEWLLPLNGLDVPPDSGPVGQILEIGTLEKHSATRLFINCLRRVRPGLHLTSQDGVDIGQICRLLEGMPLAIELTAAWYRALPVAHMATETQRALDLLTTNLRDVPPRHRSIRAIFDYSWKLLSADLAARLRQMALFRGGFTLSAAQTVAGASLTELAELIDRSWLRSDESGRYQMHELVRQYALERLEQEHIRLSQEEPKAVQARHAAHYAAFLNNEMNQINRSRGALSDIIVEFGNIEAAWNWATQMGDRSLAFPLLMGIYFAADMLGWHSLAHALFGAGDEALRAHLRAEVRPPTELDELALLVSNILQIRGSLTTRWGHLNQGLTWALQAETFAQGVQPSPTQGFALICSKQLQAAIRWLSNELDTAEQILRGEVIPYWENAITSEFQDPDFLLANSYMALGSILLAQERYPEARQLLTQSLAVKERSGEFRFRAATYRILALVHGAEGRVAEGLDAAWQSVGLSREYGDRVHLSLALTTLARLLLLNGQSEAAHRCSLDAISIAEETGNGPNLVLAQVQLARIALAQSRPEEANQVANQALVRYRQDGLELVRSESEIWLVLGESAQAAGQTEAAVQAYQTLLALPRATPSIRRAGEEALAGVCS